MQLFDVSPGMALVSVVMVIRAKNPVHLVLFFIFVSRNISGLPLLLDFDFFAMIFLVVYIGAIAVLFLFVVMMLDTKIAEIHENVLRYLPVGGIIGLIFWLEIFLILDNDYVTILPINLNTLRYTVYAKRILSWTNSETLGNLLYINYPVPFPVSSPISLVATIGATVLTMHKNTKVKKQDVFWQNAIDSRNTIAKIGGGLSLRAVFFWACCFFRRKGKGSQDPEASNRSSQNPTQSVPRDAGPLGEYSRRRRLSDPPLSPIFEEKAAVPEPSSSWWERLLFLCKGKGSKPKEEEGNPPGNEGEGGSED